MLSDFLKKDKVTNSGRGSGGLSHRYLTEAARAGRDLVSVCPRKTHETQSSRRPAEQNGVLYIRMPLCLGRAGTTNAAFVAGRNEASAFPSLQFVPFFLLSQIAKMENNRRVGPASLCDLDRERSPGSKKGLPDFSRGAKGLIFLGTVGPLMEFPSV